MSEINEVSLAIGRLQSTVESHTGVHSQILEKLSSMDAKLDSRLAQQETRIQKLHDEGEQRKGAMKIVALVASFITVAFWKAVDLVVK